MMCLELKRILCFYCMEDNGNDAQENDSFCASQQNRNHTGLEGHESE